jgi:hypothetical protein
MLCRFGRRGGALVAGSGVGVDGAQSELFQFGGEFA